VPVSDPPVVLPQIGVRWFGRNPLHKHEGFHAGGARCASLADARSTR
jgi:hypothetical protein